MTHPYLFPPSSKAEQKPTTKNALVLSTLYLYTPRGVKTYPRVLKRSEPIEIHGKEAVPVFADNRETAANPQNKQMNTVRNKI